MSRDKDKYPLLDPCPPSCRRKCLEKISEERRKAIHSQFWNMDYNARRQWIFSNIRVGEPQRRILEPSSHITRSSTRFYHLPDSEGADQFVCLTFFLHTIGYKNAKIVNHTLKTLTPGAISTPLDTRGKHAPAHALSDDALQLIKDHINSYHPAVSHYRREHAPLRKYLPSELTLQGLYTDFVSKHPGVCKKERYRKTLKSMNISFAKLGEEECEVCTEHDQHKLQHADDEITGCPDCTAWAQHMERSGIARAWYKSEKERPREEDEAIVSVDMQKIIMLPRLPGIKSCVFTRRLVQFHQTFAPLGGKRSKDSVIGVVWDESLSGRNAEDVASAYVKFMRHPQYRDRRKFTFFMDNCTAQNKNWTIFTAMVDEVNKDDGPDEIIFRYFEKGHTFMSADSFHHQVEKGMREVKDVYDGADFEAIVNKTGVSARMQSSDFIVYENGVSQGAYTNKPHLRDIQEVKFRKGSSQLCWKQSMDDPSYESGDFLKKKLVTKIMSENKTFPVLNTPRGIAERKKNDIITKLCRFMPINRHQFWLDLPVNNSSVDLIDNL